MASRSKVLRLYKSLIRESKKFTTYNYRLYAIRRTQDAFRENKNEQDVEKIDNLLKQGEENLEMIKRQVLLGKLYGEGSLIIESSSKKS